MADYVIGVDAGTESFRAGVFDRSGKCLGFGVSANKTVHRHPGWAEQSPRDWDTALADSIRKALEVSHVAAGDIRGIGIDGTSCTVVFLDGQGEPLRDALMWMDIRAVKEAADVAATGDAALLLKTAEEYIQTRSGALMIVETSSTQKYERTRAFYVKYGYAELARIRQYYRPGDDLIIYGKYFPTT